MKEFDFKIETLASEELISLCHKERANNKHLDALMNTNHISFIARFLAEPLQINGKFIKDTHFSDLINIYYLDYKLKLIIARYALDIERFFDVSMINSNLNPGDKTNSISKKIQFFESLDKKTQNKVLIFFNNKIIFDNLNLKQFILYMDATRYIRNCTLHHYPVIHYEYANKIKNGEAHKKKNGPQRNINEDLYMMMRLLKPRQRTRLKNKLEKHYLSIEYSTKEIRNNVEKFIRNLFKEIYPNVSQKILKKDIKTVLYFIKKKDI